MAFSLTNKKWTVDCSKCKGWNLGKMVFCFTKKSFAGVLYIKKIQF